MRNKKHIVLFSLFTAWVGVCTGAETLSFDAKNEEASLVRGVTGNNQRTLRMNGARRNQSKSSLYSYGDRYPDDTKEHPSPDKDYLATIKEPLPTLRPTEEGDLNIRFNKITYPDGVPESLQLPLTMEDYPITGETAAILRTQSLADAVVLEDDFDMRGKDPSKYVNALGGPPSFPNKDPNNPFWAQLEAVVDAQILRRWGGEPDFTLPMLWADKDIDDVALAVYHEYPGKHQADMLKKFFKEGLEVDYSVMPFRSKRDIVSLQFRFAYLNTWAIECVGAVNFCIKWAYGRPRPEEVAYQIATGEITEGVPDDLKSKILSMNLENATSFTAYPEGSPSHPAWPAMHSAASAVSFWLRVVTNLTSEQYCEALRVDYGVAYARTVAGVHYPDDNIMGLNLGQAILADRMPEHFAENFGSDPDAVREKITRMRFDWNDFNVDECSIAGVPIV
jgi:membrane-associated phospholipid phosphatase